MFEICQKDTRPQCVRANDGKGGKAKMIVELNCRRKRLARKEARLAGGVITEWKTENRKEDLLPEEIWRKMLEEIKLE